MSDDDKAIKGLPQGLQLKVDDPIAQGMYSNFQIVGSNETEFVLDFAYVQPQQPRGKVRARIILSPKHAKSLLRLMQERVRSYEAQFGEISVPRPSLVPSGGSGLPN